MLSSGLQVIVRLVVDELIGKRNLAIDVTELGELSVPQVLILFLALSCAVWATLIHCHLVLSVYVSVMGFDLSCFSQCMSV